jgi:two-component system response regulator HydG
MDPGALEEVLAGRLVSETPSLLPFVERIALAARHELPVLLHGETGTGKTFLARLIHDHSPRRQERFLAVPCGAIPRNLIESELFGHVRGAFTGADRNRLGKLDAVGAGTLLLDEIDTLNLQQQATLLRVLETGEFEPVGCNTTHHCLARLIVASNVDLENAVVHGKFRADLYFRLDVLSLHLLPLRARAQDIAPLVRGMIARFNRKFRKQLHDVGAEAEACLRAFPWPGNIRQLENVIQHAVLVSEGPELLLEYLPQAVRHCCPAASFVNRDAAVRRPPSEGIRQAREFKERELIHRALASNSFIVTRAAQSLGISRVALYHKMKKYDLMSGRHRKAAAR